jgi:hypothetical protein
MGAGNSFQERRASYWNDFEGEPKGVATLRLRRRNTGLPNWANRRRFPRCATHPTNRRDLMRWAEEVRVHQR